jgi:UDP-N-acetylmuramyl pentapeptide phosphotransferase/UDP-N-acetylglucosamine-1-phosphate transferase
MEDRVTCLLALGGAGLAAWIAAAVVSRPRWAAMAAGRDVHAREVSDPIGRGGGVAVAVPVLLAALICGFPSSLAPSAAGVLVVASLTMSFLVGLVDDVRPLGPLAKFIGQCLAAAALAIAAAWSGLGWVAIVLAVLVSLWSQNAWNFIDGTDGLMAAGGIAVFSVGGVLAWEAGRGQPEFVLLSALVVAGLLGFLPWNVPSARLFLGDSGSLFIGGAYAICTLMAFQSSPGLGWAWVALAAPVHADVLVCLARRVVRGCRWWEGHREHAYQHLAHRRGSHLAPLAVGGALWLLIAVPSALLALEFGWAAAVGGVATCGAAVLALGSGRPVEVSVAAASRETAAESARGVTRPGPVAPAGLSMSGTSTARRTPGDLLVDTGIVERGPGGTLASSSLRK